MQERSFFADSVIEALAEARQVMGEESYLVEARRAPRGAAGAFEVLVRAGETGRPAAKPVPGIESDAYPARSGVEAEMARLSEEVARLRQWICEVRRDGPVVPRWLEPWRSRMLEQGVPVDLVRRLMDLAEEQDARGADPCLALWRRCLHDFVVPGGESFQTRRIAFVGPAGAGKTTLAVKAAIRLGLEQRRSVGLVALDGWRAAGYQTLRALAGLIGAPFTWVEEPALLPAALREFGNKELVIVDTPGFTPGEMADAQPWADALVKTSGLQRHLVLTASTRSADLESAAGRWQMFEPQRLAFTRLDETSGQGMVPGLAALTGIPVSFLSCGARIPEDFEIGSSGRLLEMALSREAMANTRCASAG